MFLLLLSLLAHLMKNSSYIMLPKIESAQQLIPARLGIEQNNPNAGMIIQYFSCISVVTRVHKVVKYRHPSFFFPFTSCDCAAEQFNLRVFRFVCCLSRELAQHLPKALC